MVSSAEHENFYKLKARGHKNNTPTSSVFQMTLYTEVRSQYNLDGGGKLSSSSFIQFLGRQFQYKMQCCVSLELPPLDGTSTKMPKHM